MSKIFAMTGVAGYVAPKHLKAIKDTGNRLVAACDPHDSVGILDRYFSDVSFFTEFERFDRHAEMLKRENSENGINYVTICSPNYLHDAHVRYALRIGADAICEKPLVLNPWNIDALADLESETGQKVYTILQLRVHPSLIALKRRIDAEPADKIHDVQLSYVTSRGLWYLNSWKGRVEQSGGLATNIGVHFFDLLGWLFGPTKEIEVHAVSPLRIAGYLEFVKARVRWFLSIDKSDLPQDSLAEGQTTFRSIKIDSEEVEFSTGFTDLHTEVYRRTLAGHGFGLETARQSIQIVHDIRELGPIGPNSRSHPFLK